MPETPLDEVDRGILFTLQRDARDTTIAEIAEEVEVSASTVRNRIDRLEADGIIEGYYPKINYERAGFPLRVLTEGGTLGFGLTSVQQIAVGHGWKASVGNGTDGGPRFEFTNVPIVE